MSSLSALLFILLFSFTYAIFPQEPVQDKTASEAEKKSVKLPNAEVPLIEFKNNEVKPKITKESQASKKDTTKSSTVSDTTAKTKTENIKSDKKYPDDVDSGVLRRGVWVLVGISLIFIMYIGFKTYRRRNKKSVMIRKYGVRARRNDVEMEPLPIDDDEDDETIFELGAGPR